MNNRDLRRDRIWTWSLPAWVTTLNSGRKFNVCPSAMACAKLCYARKGTYRFKNVRAKHVRNLEMLLDDLSAWEAQMTEELQHKRFEGSHVRIHDGGDFFSRDYLDAWLRIIGATPNVTFYAYTKEVYMFKDVVEPNAPENFRWIYSHGGRWDNLILDSDRQADVFPTSEALIAAGYEDQEDSDLLAIYGHHKVGIVVNNHPGAVKSMQGKSFGDM
jgi:hypothetical protein